MLTGADFAAVVFAVVPSCCCGAFVACADACAFRWMCLLRARGLLLPVLLMLFLCRFFGF